MSPKGLQRLTRELLLLSSVGFQDSTLKQLGLPVLSFLVLSSSDEVINDALHRQEQWLQRAHPACKPLLVCPDLALPLSRECSGAHPNSPATRWHAGQTGNPKHSQHQQHELLLLHNGVGPRALALATLDLQVSQELHKELAVMSPASAQMSGTQQ